MNDLAKNIVLWIVIAVVVATVVSNFSARSNAVQDIPYSQFLEQVKEGGISEVKVNKHTDVIRGKRSNGEDFVVYSPETENDALIDLLVKQNVKFDGTAPERQSFLMQLFISSFPILLLIAVWVYFMRQMQGGAGGRGAMSFGKSRARLLSEDQVQVTFADVAGVGLLARQGVEHVPPGHVVLVGRGQRLEDDEPRKLRL